jgi:hypothetical protein
MWDPVYFHWNGRTWKIGTGRSTGSSEKTPSVDPPIIWAVSWNYNSCWSCSHWTHRQTPQATQRPCWTWLNNSLVLGHRSDLTCKSGLESSARIQTMVEQCYRFARNLRTSPSKVKNLHQLFWLLNSFCIFRRMLCRTRVKSVATRILHLYAEIPGDNWLVQLTMRNLWGLPQTVCLRYRTQHRKKLIH